MKKLTLFYVTFTLLSCFAFASTLFLVYICVYPEILCNKHIYLIPIAYVT